MTELIMGASIVALVALISGVHVLTRHRRPMWGVCSVCDVRTIYINGMGKWLHVRGDEDPDGDGHTATPRPRSVHLRSR